MERAQSELNNLEATKAEAEEQKRVAEEVRAEIVAGADYGDLVDKVVNLTYENQKLQEENRGLRYKLNEAYEFMKQFVINGRNDIMIEVLQNEKLKMFCDTSFLDKNIKNIFLTETHVV